MYRHSFPKIQQNSIYFKQFILSLCFCSSQKIHSRSYYHFKEISITDILPPCSSFLCISFCFFSLSFQFMYRTTEIVTCDVFFISKNSFKNRIRYEVHSCPNGGKSFWSLFITPLISGNTQFCKGKVEIFAKQFAENFH